MNPSIFIASGGIRCVCSAILDCPSGRMQEAMIAGLLYLLDGPDRRSASGLNLRFLVAPYSDFHYKHYGDAAVGGAPLDAAGGGLGNNPATGSGAADRELRLLCAKQALLSVLHSWGGLLHLVSCRILDDLVRVLLPCHLETRASISPSFRPVHVDPNGPGRLESHAGILLHSATSSTARLDRRVLRSPCCN